MINELDILKKHLGEVEGKTQFNAMQICDQINDANDFIGALQVLELTLKKLVNNLNQRAQSDDIQKRELDAINTQLIQNCSFMGTALFGNIFNVFVGQKEFKLEVYNPLLILENSDYDGMLAYVEDKKDEISSMLKDIASAITLSMSNDLFLGNNGKIDLDSLFR